MPNQVLQEEQSSPAGLGWQQPGWGSHFCWPQEPKQAASLFTPCFGNGLPPPQLALKATGLQGGHEMGCQEAQEQNKAALLHKGQPETEALWGHTRMMCSGGILPHLKDIPVSLRKTSQKEGLWLCSAFSFGWGLGRRKYCEEKGVENLDPKALVFYFSATLYTSSPHEKP